MTTYKKHDFPVSQIRRFLEPGPVVLVSSAWQGRTDIMTMGWHMVMEFTPALVGCLIASGNHSYELVGRSRECVINVPTVELAGKVAKIGNCSGVEVDKFKKSNSLPWRPTRSRRR
jgi:flavin reductase (DIM6/NTAB) family NADH-FMN oxidoreductase RutF